MAKTGTNIDQKLEYNGRRGVFRITESTITRALTVVLICARVWKCVFKSFRKGPQKVFPGLYLADKADLICE